jgi:50S ribosomal subunit-associated GTPase HflX
MLALPPGERRPGTTEAGTQPGPSSRAEEAEMGTSTPDELAEVEHELSGLRDSLTKLDMEGRAGTPSAGPREDRRAELLKSIERRTKRLEELKAAINPASRKPGASTT